MNPHHGRGTGPDIMSVASWCLAVAIALMLSASYLLDGPSETQAAQDVADYSAALADGGVALCAEFDRVPSWTKSGDLVCRAASAPVARVAQGGAP
ncbi:hypothetical protein [Polaromonas sp.]|uniref:hypothetical protein n=1 Tax=Polaromonas sp. TaxID=1869339 RepID=UPI003BB6416A